MFQKRGQFVSEGVNLYKIIIIMTSRVLLMGGNGYNCSCEANSPSQGVGYVLHGKSHDPVSKSLIAY